MFGKLLDLLGVKTRKGRENAYGYIFILPWLIGFLGLTAGPMIFSLVTSFADYNMLKIDFIGLGNYERMFFKDQLFFKALGNTLFYAVLNIPLVTAGGVIVAVILNKSVFGLRTFRTIYYLPSIMVGVGTYFLWMLMLDPSTGIINAALDLIGIDGPAWLSDPNWTKPAIIVMHLWGLGGQMLLYLARLQSIPQDYYEAASLDGASAWQKFRKITVPLLSPIIFYNLTIGIIGAFQVFQEGYIFSGDGTGKPAGSLLFYNLHVWNQAFKNFDTGYANALCWFLFAVVMLLTVINNRVSKKWVHYD
ncbi:MAG TPA: sugar ABC transporter permease [Candidatus Eisenbergiella merdigallinarum]|uniref:Sugar ABC transporter permease n=1 Tax=Candidatus Eisenbergiella merdigallinarum TaxID=2838552 RepID=A0A9D2MN75_9FIRM|nr:sugar ABC transporter permease [Candidatus Eisenbergiella merdigallinarum]